MTITKLDLTRHLSDTVGLTARECKAVVDTLFDTIRTTLASGEDVKLLGTMMPLLCSRDRFMVVILP